MRKTASYRVSRLSRFFLILVCTWFLWDVNLLFLVCPFVDIVLNTTYRNFPWFSLILSYLGMYMISVRCPFVDIVLNNTYRNLTSLTVYYPYCGFSCVYSFSHWFALVTNWIDPHKAMSKKKDEGVSYHSIPGNREKKVTWWGWLRGPHKWWLSG